MEYQGIFNDWQVGITSFPHRSITPEAFNEARVVIYDNEALLPYGRNSQLPDRFKIINTETKKQFFSQKSPLVENDDNYKPPFFNQKDFEDKDYIIVTEGEWDCLSWISEGYTNAVSLPNGISCAEATFKREFKYLMQFKTIYVNFDADEPGQLGLEKVREIIPKYRLRTITFKLEGIKDANDALKAGFALKGFFDTADGVKMASVVHASEVPIEDIFAATPEGVRTGFSDFDNILGGLRPAEVTSVTGDTGCGKTTFVVNVAYNVAAATCEGVWITSQEMRIAKILQKMGSIILQKSLRDNVGNYEDMTVLEKIFKEKKIYVDPIGEQMTLKSVLESIDYGVHVHGIKFVVIEDLGYLGSSAVGDNERERLEFAVKLLHAKALETGVHILVIVHPTQSKDDRGFMGMANMKGSSGIKQYGDNVIILQRLDRAYPDVRQVHAFTRLEVRKNRAKGKEGELILDYHQDYDGYSTSLTSPEKMRQIVKEAKKST